MKKIAYFVPGFVLLSPFLALAEAVTGPLGQFKTLVANIGIVISSLVPILIALAVAWFIWNVIRYTIAADESKKSEAKSQMIWGIIALAVIVSMWGLVAWLQNLFGIEGDAILDVMPAGGLLNVTPVVTIPAGS